MNKYIKKLFNIILNGKKVGNNVIYSPEIKRDNDVIFTTEVKDKPERQTGFGDGKKNGFGINEHYHSGFGDGEDNGFGI